MCGAVCVGLCGVCVCVCVCVSVRGDCESPIDLFYLTRINSQ